MNKIRCFLKPVTHHHHICPGLQYTVQLFRRLDPTTDDQQVEVPVAVEVGRHELRPDDGVDQQAGVERRFERRRIGRQCRTSCRPAG